MHDQLIVFLSAFCVLVASGRELKLWNESDCPSIYSVYSSDGQRIDIEIINTSNLGCKNLVGNKRNLKELPDLKPSIEAAYKNGQYVANITWTYTTKGRKLPKQFVLNMTFYEGGIVNHRYSNDTCVTLVLTSGRRLNYKRTRTPTTVEFFFDCLPLQGPQHFGLLAEVWIFPRKTTRRCRSARSLPDGTRKCGTPGAQCSTSSSFGVALDSHKFRQCACYSEYHGDPVLLWERDSRSGKFKITVTNLPPYLQPPVEIDVFSNDTDVFSNDRNYKDQYLEVSVFKNDTVEVFTAEPKESVNYEVYVRVNVTLYAKCQAPGRYEKEYREEIIDTCPDGDFIFIENHKRFKDVPVFGDEKYSAGMIDYPYLVLILVAVISTGVITTITFILCRRKSRGTHSSSSPPTNSDNGIRTCPAVSRTEQNTEHVDENVDYRRRVYEHEDNAENDSEVGKLMYSRQSSSPADTALETCFCTREIQRIPVLCVQCEKKSNKQDRVSQFISAIRKTCLLKLETVRIAQNGETNCGDIMSSSNNMIVIMTKAIIDICRNSAKMRRIFNSGELERNRTSLHLVSLGNDGESCDIIMQFLSDHGLRERTNCFPYYLVGDHVDSDDNKYVLNLLIKRLCCNGSLDSCAQKSVLDKANKTTHSDVHGELGGLREDVHRAILELNMD